MQLDEIGDLNTASQYVISKMQQNDIDYIKSKQINELDSMLALAHHGFGTHIRNTLGLWNQETPVVKWFSERYDLRHADDISSIIIENAFRQIMGIEGDEWIQTEVDRYHRHWLAAGLPRHGMPEKS